MVLLDARHSREGRESSSFSVFDPALLCNRGGAPSGTCDARHRELHGIHQHMRDAVIWTCQIQMKSAAGVAMASDNLVSLHKHEEHIRADSHRLIEKNRILSDHLTMVHGAMAVIYALVHDHASMSEDELTMQLLGLRLFNSAASSLKLGLSGYYQSAFAVMRDIFETAALIDYLQSCPEKIAVWKASGKKQRIREFGPGPIRDALNKRDKLSGNKRKMKYDRFSEYASHPAAPGFELLAPDGLGKIGPFLDEKYLKAWLEEGVVFLVEGATVFTNYFEKIEEALLMEKATFLNEAVVWWQKYMGAPNQPGLDTE